VRNGAERGGAGSARDTSTGLKIPVSAVQLRPPAPYILPERDLGRDLCHAGERRHAHTFVRRAEKPPLGLRADYVVYPRTGLPFGHETARFTIAGGLP
jgi:hypothetical protein